VRRSTEAVEILSDELAERFQNRDRGYTRIVRLPSRRLGDGGQKAILEFTGERDRPKSSRAKAPVVKKESTAPAESPRAAETPAPSESSDEKSEA
jgi:large subunit ribosomal protein L17